MRTDKPNVRGKEKPPTPFGRAGDTAARPRAGSQLGAWGGGGRGTKERDSGSCSVEGMKIVKRLKTMLVMIKKMIRGHSIHEDDMEYEINVGQSKKKWKRENSEKGKTKH